MDSVSFVLEAAGVRGAIDPVIEDHLAVRSRTGLTHAQFFSCPQDSARREHSASDPMATPSSASMAPANASTTAPPSPLRTTADGVTARLDLDPAYECQASSVRRETTLLPDGSVVIADSWTALADRPVAVAWRLLTSATATLAPDGVRLEQAGKTLHLRVSAREDARIELQPVSTLMREGADPGWTRIVIHVSTPAGAGGARRVTAVPARESSPRPVGGCIAVTATAAASAGTDPQDAPAA